MQSIQTVKQILSVADVKINGSRPWDIKVHNPKLYSRILSGGSLAAGESYMDGWWDVDQLDEFFTRILRAKLQHKIKTFSSVLNYFGATMVNMQSPGRSKKVAQEHYDLGNDFYESMLDKNMQYTCAYWNGAKTLDKAQENKLELVCKKLQLKKGEKVLELGCGWGGFARYAAKKYGVEVDAYNISKEQVEYGKEWNKKLSVNMVLSDYRNAQGVYDKVVSIGMCEHVGYKNYGKFVELAYRRLNPGGLFLLHTIGTNVSVKTTDPWIQKYIFPNSMLPSIVQLSKAFEGLFVMEDWHNLGTDYYKTLMEWDKNFRKNWPKFKDKYGERFYRMWRFYLMSSAGQFKSRRIQLWQVVLSKSPVDGHISVR
jgi:cyclopropane-fatty-acyl-phospholipid synthase